MSVWITVDSTCVFFLFHSFWSLLYVWEDLKAFWLFVCLGKKTNIVSYVVCRAERVCGQSFSICRVMSSKRAPRPLLSRYASQFHWKTKVRECGCGILSDSCVFGHDRRSQELNRNLKRWKVMDGEVPDCENTTRKNPAFKSLYKCHWSLISNMFPGSVVQLYMMFVY